MFLRILPFIISMIVLAAHFLRDGNTIFMVLCLAVPFVLLIKTPWALQTARVFTYAGVLIWAITTVNLISARLSLGSDWMRMALILSAVAVFTGWAGYLLGNKKIRHRYK